MSAPALPINIAERCERLAKDVEHAKSQTFCESVEQLERYHDVLVSEVAKLAELVAALAARGESNRRCR